MKKNYFIVLILFLTCLCCTKGHNVKGIEVSQEIIDGSEMIGIDYCQLYEKALDRDSISIREYSTIESFEGAFIYVHGVYLIRLIDRIGDDLYIKVLKRLNKKHLSIIATYIIAGLDIYDSYFTGGDAIQYVSQKDYWDKHPKIWMLVNNRYEKETDI